MEVKNRIDVITAIVGIYKNHNNGDDWLYNGQETKVIVGKMGWLLDVRMALQLRRV